MPAQFPRPAGPRVPTRARVRHASSLTRLALLAGAAFALLPVGGALRAQGSSSARRLGDVVELLPPAAYDGLPIDSTRTLTIDVTNGQFAVAGARRYATRARVMVIVRNINPFAAGRIALRDEVRPIASSDFTTVASLFPMLGIALEKAAAAQPASDSAATAEPAPPGADTVKSAVVDAAQKLFGLLDNRGRAVPAACSQDGAVGRRVRALADQMTALDMHTRRDTSWSAEVETVGQAALSLQERPSGGSALAQEASSLVPRIDALAAGRSALPPLDSLRGLAKALADSASALRSATATCATLVTPAVAAAESATGAATAAAVRRSAADEAHRTLQSLGRTIRTLLRTGAAWAIRHEIGDYDSATVVKLTVEQTMPAVASGGSGKSAANPAPRTSTLGSTEVRFGRANFLALGVGVGHSRLADRSFAVVTGPDSVRRIGTERDDAARTPVMALVHARVLDLDLETLWLPRLTLHLTGGGSLTSQTSAEGDRDWLLGLTLGAAAERVFLTLGYMSGVVTHLDPTYRDAATTGAEGEEPKTPRVPISVNEIPTTTSRTGKLGVALSFRLR